MAYAPCWIFDRPARLAALAERARDRCNAAKSRLYHAERERADAPTLAALDGRHRLARSRAHRLRRLAEASGARLVASRRGRPAAMAEGGSPRRLIPESGIARGPRCSG